MSYTSYTESSVVRTDWTIDESNTIFDLSFNPVYWSVFAFVNRVHAKVTLVYDNYVRLAVAPETSDQVDFQFVVSDVGVPILPVDYLEEISRYDITRKIEKMS